VGRLDLDSAHQPYFVRRRPDSEKSATITTFRPPSAPRRNNPYSRNKMTQSSRSEPTDAAARPGSRLLPMAVAVVVLLGLALGGTLAVELFVVERLPELTVETLDAAEKLWDAKGPKSYDLDLTIEGAQPGLVHVEVRAGVTTAMQRDGLAPQQRRVWDVWAVPGMFETIERELELAADPQHEMDLSANTQVDLRAEFDPQSGYPARFHRIVFGGGPEVYWKVTNFTPK
jgi:hypothetical protein